MSDALVFAHAAALIADPARAIMLNVLLDGRARPAGELAHACGVTAQTASAHLGKLLDGGILAVESEGRHRYYRIAGADIIDALENLAAIAASRPAKPKALSPLARLLPERVAAIDLAALQPGCQPFDPHRRRAVGEAVGDGVAARRGLQPVVADRLRPWRPPSRRRPGRGSSISDWRWPPRRRPDNRPSARS